MAVVVLGVNHNTAPVEVRERLYVSEEAVPSLLSQIQAQDLQETVILSTCNRTEIYFSSEEPDSALKKVVQIAAHFFQTPLEWFEQYTYSLRDEDAYRHLFVVASGLDSMVIGEPQILGQVKDAYRIAAHHNTTGFLLDKVFHRTFTVAKRIRTETRIGYNPVSISSMAVELSKKIFGDLPAKKILVVGAGEMCEIALKQFKKEGVVDIFVVNRTFQNAQKVAEEVTGLAHPFDHLESLLGRVDMVLSSTGAEKPVIDKGLVHRVMKTRKHRPLFFIDIAVPRDVDPAVNDVENVYLYDIDDLKELAQKHLTNRLVESEKAASIIDDEVTRFQHWLKQLDMAPLITHIFDAVEQMRNKELQKTLRKLKHVDNETLQQVDLLTKNIVNKLVHPHVVLLKQNGGSNMLEIIKKIFSYEEEDDKEMDSRDKGQ